MKKVRNVIVTIATTSEITLFVIEIAAPVRPSTFVAPPRLDRVPDLLDDVVLRLQEAEPALALGQVVDVAGDGLDEVVDLVDERRDEGVADPGDRRDRQDVGDPGRASRDSSPRGA